MGVAFLLLDLHQHTIFLLRYVLLQIDDFISICTSFDLFLQTLNDFKKAAAVAQLFERSPRMRKVRCSKPNRDT